MLAAVRTRSFPVLMPEMGARAAARRPARRRARLSPLGRALLTAVLIVLPAVAYVGQTTASARAGYAILTLRQEIEALQAENARLVASVTALRSPERIERAATRQLGMVRPSPAQLAALTLPVPTAAVPVAAAPTLWQRVGALLLGREALAGER
jgi:cell division protein FtsL